MDLGNVIIKSEVIFSPPKLTFSVSDQAHMEQTTVGGSMIGELPSCTLTRNRSVTSYEFFSAACQGFVHNLLLLRSQSRSDALRP